jgi:hypothetical protein
VATSIKESIFVIVLSRLDGRRAIRFGPLTSGAYERYQLQSDPSSRQSLSNPCTYADKLYATGT